MDCHPNMGGSFHDITRDEVFDVLCAVAQSGLIGVCHAGPPCGPFSSLRLRPNGPRPLMDADHPFGFDDLEDHEQVKLDDAILVHQRVVVILTIVLERGGSVIWENPVTSGARHLPFVKEFLKKLPQFAQCSMCQVISGDQQPWEKTWTFQSNSEAIMAINKPCTHQQKHSSMAGRTDQFGNFVSASTAEYPLILTDCFAEAFDHLIDSRPSGLQRYTHWHELTGCCQQPPDQAAPQTSNKAELPSTDNTAIDYHSIFLKDGGGIHSTADWQVCPPMGLRDPLGDFRKLITANLPSDVIYRFRKRLDCSSEEPFLTDDEVANIRKHCISLLQDSGLHISETIPQGQPYWLDMFDALISLCKDPDSSLIPILRSGTPAGVQEPIPYSGIFYPASHNDHVEGDHQDLACCAGHHITADLAPEELDILIKDEIKQGFLVQYENLEEAQRLFGEWTAVGKFAVVKATGRKPRLIGDSKVSGASPASTILEQTEAPSLASIAEALSRSNKPADHWMFLSLDIKSAHKTVRLRIEDQGLALFHWHQSLVGYRVNHFGAKWSAYWWSRVAGVIIRLMHVFLRHEHIAIIYVDDLLVLLPKSVFAIMATQVIAFMQVLGVPLSWSKLEAGTSIKYLGWHLSIQNDIVTAKLTEDKIEKLLDKAKTWLKDPRRIHRDELSAWLGLLIWTTQLSLILRPFLAPFYWSMYKPNMKLQNLAVPQLEEIVRNMDEGLTIRNKARLSDVQSGWTLHSIGGIAVVGRSNATDLLRSPKLRNGRVWLRFTSVDKFTRFDDHCRDILKFLINALTHHSFRVTRPPIQVYACAADAWASKLSAGLGGWFSHEGQTFFFHLPIRHTDIPESWQLGSSLQHVIAGLECLAQVCLLFARYKLIRAPFQHRLTICQASDNASTVGALSKMLSSKPFLSATIQTLASLCLALQCEVQVYHLSGERNSLADQLSRRNEQVDMEWPPAGCSPQNEIQIDLTEILDYTALPSRL
jgi:hypothetical protein